LVTSESRDILRLSGGMVRRRSSNHMIFVNISGSIVDNFVSAYVPANRSHIHFTRCLSSGV